ncbi:MAG: carboxypeptidase regulatory-like domain-containing protein [Lewinellaceae bacterium]|nr:carboxypeptidase regulatory-like domain-containing protein [Lewinellaceae bacterium]
MKRSFILLLLVATAFVACQKENLPDDSFQKELNLGNLTTATAYGLVVDESNNPVSEALVSLGNKTDLTDENGVFRISKAQVTENLAQVTVQKEGYFLGSRSFQPRYDNNPNIRIKLLSKTKAGTIESTDGGVVSLGNAISVNFQSNSVVQSNGQPYSGKVDVAMQYIDPSASDLAQRMPGSLLGFSEEEGLSSLATFGMVAVELTGDQGQVLQLASGKPATLEVSVPAALMGKAPAVIPLWHFDETVGIWVEEGEAILENGRYVGQVGHFSFWNCDVSFPLVHMEGSVFLDSLGNPVQDLLVHFTIVSSSSTGFGYTDENGQFNGYIPSGEELLLELIDNCGAVVYSATVGPFTADVVLDPIVLATGDLTYTPVEISGTLVDCDTMPVTNGYVMVQAGQNMAIFQVDPATGDFTGTFQACDTSDFTLVGIDETNLLQSEELTFTPAPTVAAGPVAACAIELDEYVQITMDGVDYLYVNYVSLKDTIPGAGFILIAQGSSTFEKMALVTSATGIGTYPALEFGFGFGNYAQDPENISVTVTEFGPAVGDLVRGTFEGSYTDAQGNPHTVSGAFKAVRE